MSDPFSCRVCDLQHGALLVFVAGTKYVYRYVDYMTSCFHEDVHVPVHRLGERPSTARTPHTDTAASTHLTRPPFPTLSNLLSEMVEMTQAMRSRFWLRTSKGLLSCCGVQCIAYLMTSSCQEWWDTNNVCYVLREILVAIAVVVELISLSLTANYNNLSAPGPRKGTRRTKSVLM